MLQQTPIYHIDAYIFAKHGQTILPFLTNEDIRSSLTKYFGIKPTDADLLVFIGSAQNDKVHEVKALVALGIPQIRIAEMLGLSQGMISRYMKKETVSQFMPYKFIDIIRRRYANNKEHEWKYYYETYCKDLTGIKFS